MRFLFDGRLAPITHSIGFLETTFENVVNAFQEWLESLHKKVTFEHVDASFEQALLSLEPLKLARTKTLLLETGSPWVAYFDNGVRGPDLASPIWYMAQQKLKCRGVAATCIPHTLKHPLAKGAKGLYGATMFSYLDSDIAERTVYVMNDGGPWAFYESGNRLPFEETAQYEARRTRDRFTAEMLERYCAAVGIRMFDESFYGPVGFLLQAELNYPNPSFNLADARARDGLS